MVPDVKQYLEGLRKTMSEVILPHVQSDAFAGEQAGLIIASLNLLIEVHDKQYPYEYLEHDEYKRLLRGLLPVVKTATPPAEVAAILTDIRTQCDESDAVVAKGLPSYTFLQTSTRGMKTLLTLLLEALASAGQLEVLATCRRHLAPLIDRQVAREMSWTRKTGFDPEAGQLPAIDDILFGPNGRHLLTMKEEI